jgi:phosphoribosylamine-glycine ligase
LIITRDGARVLEFNCRFGDPEHSTLPRMKSDLVPLLEATIDGNLGECAIEWMRALPSQSCSRLGYTANTKLENSFGSR